MAKKRFDKEAETPAEEKKPDVKTREQELAESRKKHDGIFRDENDDEITFDEYVEKFGNPFKKKEVK